MNIDTVEKTLIDRDGLRGILIPNRRVKHGKIYTHFIDYYESCLNRSQEFFVKRLYPKNYFPEYPGEETALFIDCPTAKDRYELYHKQGTENFSDPSFRGALISNDKPTRGKQTRADLYRKSLISEGISFIEKHFPIDYFKEYPNKSMTLFTFIPEILA